METGKVILLNGTSSSGKSTLAKLLQTHLAEAFLHVQLDDFIGMLPPTNDSAMFDRMVRGMNRSVRELAAEGNNLIVDHVLVVDAWLWQLVSLLHEQYVLFVGVHCGLEELERRERTRDQRRQGFARQQFDRVHAGRQYDVEVDTEKESPDACAARVCCYYRDRSPNAFASLWRAHQRCDG